MRLAVAVLSIASLGPLVPACSGGSSKPIDAAVDDGDGGLDATADAPVAIDASGDALTAGCTPRSGTTIALEPVVSGLSSPIGLTSPPGDPRLFVVQQGGQVRIIDDTALAPTPYLNLGGANGPVLSGGERGLLGLAFHPRFAENGKLYVNFTRKPDGATVIAEFTAASPTAATVDVATRRDLLVIPQPYANHNGGWLEFGNDGLLYIGMGDGGSGGDPQDRAQNDAELLGKMLRIDVNARTGAKAYAIPPGNPFATSADGPTDPRPEIWHKGLRNPFR